MEPILFNVKKLYFLTFKKICLIEFFEKIELKRYNHYLELYNTSKQIHRRKCKEDMHFWTCDVILFPIN